VGKTSTRTLWHAARTSTRSPCFSGKHLRSMCRQRMRRQTTNCKPRTSWAPRINRTTDRCRRTMLSRLRRGQHGRALRTSRAGLDRWPLSHRRHSSTLMGQWSARLIVCVISRSERGSTGTTSTLVKRFTSGLTPRIGSAFLGLAMARRLLFRTHSASH